MWLEAIAGNQSRIVMNSDQWIVTNGTNSASPMTFINGELTLMVAKINEITSGLMRSRDSKVVFDLDNKFLVFRD